MPRRAVTRIEGPITEQEERFCQEYLVDLDAKATTERMGWKSATTAARLLTRPKIKKRLNELKTLRALRTGITADEVLVELYRAATLDVTQIINENGVVRSLHTLPDAVKRCITSLDVSEERGRDGTITAHVKKIRFTDKLKALEMLGKHLELFRENVNVNVTHTLDVRSPLAEAQERLEKYVQSQVVPVLTHLNERHDESNVFRNSTMSQNDAVCVGGEEKKETL